MVLTLAWVAAGFSTINLILVFGCFVPNLANDANYRFATAGSALATAVLSLVLAFLDPIWLIPLFCGLIIGYLNASKWVDLNKEAK